MVCCGWIVFFGLIWVVIVGWLRLLCLLGLLIVCCLLCGLLGFLFAWVDWLPVCLVV